MSYKTFKVAIFASVLCLISAVSFAEITGPKVVEPGRLAVFESTIEGNFTVYTNASDCFAKDTNHKICTSPARNPGTTR